MFIEAVKKIFEQYLYSIGFKFLFAEETLMVYQKNDLQIRIFYGKRMRQIGFEFVFREKTYDLENVIGYLKLNDVVFSRFTASDADGVEICLNQLLAILKEKLMIFVSGDESIFEKLDEYIIDINKKDYFRYKYSEQVRLADEAWENKNFKEVVKNFKEIPLEELDVIQKRKLFFALKKIK